MRLLAAVVSAVTLTCRFLMLISAAIFSAVAEADKNCFASGGSSRGKREAAVLLADIGA